MNCPWKRKNKGKAQRPSPTMLFYVLFYIIALQCKATLLFNYYLLLIALIKSVISNILKHLTH